MRAAYAGASSVVSVVEVMKKGALSMIEYPYHDSDCDPAHGPEVGATATDFRVRGVRLIDVAQLAT